MRDSKNTVWEERERFVSFPLGTFRMGEGNISDDAVRVLSAEHHVDVVRGVVQRLHHLVVRVEEPFGDGERHGVFLAQLLDPGGDLR